MAATSIPHRWKYDVFVSFRGEDIRKNFMDHMFNDFKQKGIHAFRDDTELPKGEYISPHLYKAIEESRFLIVIFSKNYASSSWCLKELVKILECKHEVQIIFYDVKPDVVGKQSGSYAGAFAKHDVSNRTEVDKWKEALLMAANLSGWDLQDMTNGFESKFINSISREILKKLCDGPLHVGENLVGIDFHFDKLDLSRFVGSDKVNLIGICGMSGIGKTTLAKAIYNLMYVHFEGSCFCEDVKEVTKRQGLIQVQLHMIGEIMKIEDFKIPSVGKGIMVVKKMMSSRPTLLVLDDVDDLEQLEALAGSPTWFCPGSLIIFTGKEKQLLRSHRVDEIHEMGNLDKCEAIELFSLYAFGKRHPTEDFEEFASQIVEYLQGHPLALKVIGRSLYGKSMHVWKSELDRLQTYPNPDIQQKLRPSFDSLASDQKRMFLDIACVFIGENKDFAASVLDSSNCSANAIIEVLVDKCLITVSASNTCLQMHELIQSMAREIIREDFSMPGNHSRLWISSGDCDILNLNKVAEEVDVLVLLLKKNCQNIPIEGQALTRMKNLWILKICFPKVEGRWQPFEVNFSGRLDLLSNKLRLLYWHGCPFKYLPSNFYPENIVAIDLSYSHIKQLWTTPKCLRMLKVMKLRYCCNLTTTPDFSEITNLEELSLEGCVNLMERQWMYGMNVNDPEFVKGVQSFLIAAESNRVAKGEIEIFCPCSNCKNFVPHTDIKTIEFHLHKFGFVRKYTCWSEHGKSLFDNSTSSHVSNTNENNDSCINDKHENLKEMLHDLEANDGDIDQDDLQQLFEDAEKPVYDGCNNFSVLSAVLELLKLKANSSWSDSRFTKLLEFLHRLLPANNELPISTYQAKKILCPMGLEIERIHACPNDCMLYRGDKYENLHACVTCGTSRYKKEPDEIDDEVKKNGPPTKLLWYFSIIPRLKQLFENKKEAKLLRWHSEQRKDDGKLRHVADSPQWRKINNKFSEFSKDIRNIRFGLSSDGINPFGNMSSRYSTWPVLLCMYNLPPWLCMKRKYIMMSLLISGPKQPGNDIDMYLSPLIDDMKELWKPGVEMYDAYKKEKFMLRAMIFCTINDFPAYGNLSGYSTKGKQACPICEDETSSRWLDNCKKTVFMGHRRSLPTNHSYRHMSSEFDGDTEFGRVRTRFSGDTALSRVSNLNTVFGKGKGRQIEQGTWKKRSIFWELEYWKDLEVRHCIDVMHIEKNVCDSLIGLLLNIPGKTKDGINARKDMVSWGIRLELAPVENDKKRTYLPPACYTMSKAEKSPIL